MARLMSPYRGKYALIIGIFLLCCASFIIVEQFINNIFVTKPISIVFVIYFIVRGGISLAMYFRKRGNASEEPVEPPTV